MKSLCSGYGGVAKLVAAESPEMGKHRRIKNTEDYGNRRVRILPPPRGLSVLVSAGCPPPAFLLNILNVKYMSEVQPTTTTTLPAPLLPMRVQLPVLLEKSLPKMEEQKQNADEALNEIPDVINSKEEAEDAIATLAAVREVYHSNMKMRMEMTTITDAFKDVLMEYERDFNPDAKAKSKYNEKKKVVEAWQQREHDRIKNEQAEQAKKREAENLKVDLRARMLENLNQMVVDSVKRVDNGSKDFFASATLDPGEKNFDKKAEAYKTQKPKLKEAEYNACFQLTFNFDLIKPDDMSAIVNAVKQEETYEKWNTKFVEAVSPVINEWRAKIPDLKKNLVELEEAKKRSAEEAEALKKKQDEEAQRQQQERQLKLDQQAEEVKQQIQESAHIDKVGNDLQAQAVSQTLGDAGKTKLVMKFSPGNRMPKSFMEIVMHSMASPKFAEQFPGFQKRDHKTKKLMTDEKGRPVYIDAVQWWIDFFMDNCDGQVEGTIITEDSKVTVRK